jgi:DNA-binding MarR family transcriptional regulator
MANDYGGFMEADKSSLPQYQTRWTGYLLAQVTQNAGIIYNKKLQAIGLNAQFIAILQLLDEVGPQVQARLSTPIRIDKTTMVGLINELEQAGLVQRLPHPNDRRAVLVHLTEAGRLKLIEATKVNEQAAQEVFAVLSPQEQQAFHSMLVRLAESLAPMAAQIETD